jgi:hypothetical protein
MGQLEYPPTNREWAIQKGLLRKCPKHKIYHNSYIKCPECRREEEAAAKAAKDKEASEKLRKIEENRSIFKSIMELKFCPKCKQRSLSWNTSFGLYECLNQNCKKVFAKDEIDSGQGKSD